MSKVTIEIKCNLKGTETEMHIVILTDGRGFIRSLQHCCLCLYIQ